MLSGLVRHMEGGDSVLPCVLQFCGSPSSYLWEDSERVVVESRVMLSCLLCLLWANMMLVAAIEQD